MKLCQGMFGVKLYELKQNYEHMQNRLQLCRGENREKIRRECERLRDECRENELMLQNQALCSHSKAVGELSAAQLGYWQKARDILETKLPQYMRTEAGDIKSERAEAALLYAEYAIDFAVQATKYALLSALTAIDLQLG